MGGFWGAWGWRVVGLAGVVLLLLLSLLAVVKRGRKQQDPRAPDSAVRWRQRQRRLELAILITGILLLLTAFLTGTFEKDKLPPLWVLLVSVAGVVIGAVQLVLGYAQKRGEARRADELWTQKVRSLVDQWPLPRVSEIDPYEQLGVTPSELASHYVPEGGRPPYVARDVDSALDAALSASDLVLLVGHSKSGKSRTAYEAVLRGYPQQRLIIPSDGKALVELFQLEPPLAWDSDPAIVWLDDLQRFLGPNGLTPSLLNGLSQHPGRLRLVATLTSKRHDDYLRSTSDVDKDSQLILRRFRDLHLASELSPGETQRAKALYRDEPEEKLEAGLGEHLVAARALTWKYERGSEVLPQGHALVRAAIDWRRAGLLRPIPETALRTLAGQYLDALELPHVDLSPETFEEGLQWAREPVGLHVALLAKVGAEGPERLFEAFDYLVDHVDRQEKEIPETTWETLLGLASPADALRVGVSAYHRRRRVIARRFFERALLSRALDVHSQAANALGVLSQEEHEDARAESFYRMAIDSGQPGSAVMAMNNLGGLLLRRGDLAEAERQFLAVIASGGPRDAAMATTNLGRLHQLRGDEAESERLYRQSLDSGQPDVAAMAMNNLGSLLMEQGRTDAAEHLFQGALDSGDRTAGALAAINLGKLHQQRRDVAGAERLYRQALDSEQPDAVAMARNNLGQLFMERGELAEAERLFQAVLDSGEGEAGAMVFINLGKLHQQRGEDSEAERLYHRALDSRAPAARAMAWNNLAGLLERRGENAEAERLYRLAVDSRQSDAASLARYNLGHLLTKQGAWEEAEGLLRKALSSHHPEAMPRAALSLGSLLAERGDMAGAEHLLREALASDHPDVTPGAALLLGLLLLDKHEEAEAEGLLRRALGSSLPDVSSLAALHLGQWLQAKGETPEAELLLRKALASRNADLAQAAATALAHLRGEGAPSPRP